MKAALWFFSSIGVVTLAVTLVAQFFAWQPHELDQTESVKAEKTVIKLPPPPKAQEAPPPPEPSMASVMQNLAPESFAPVDLSAGVGFGSNGSGPAIAGGGGFGGDTSQIVNQGTAISRAPRVLLKSPPEYPAEARTRGISGYVTLRILVNQSGAIETIQVQESEPPGFFDQAALKAVRQWRFEAGLEKGRTVAQWTSQKIKFDLN